MKNAVTTWHIGDALERRLFFGSSSSALRRRRASMRESGGNEVNVVRREWLRLAAAGALTCSRLNASHDAKSASGFKAIAFDAFPILDPSPVAARAESLSLGQGGAF